MESKKEISQHALYAVIFLIIIAGLIGYQNYQAYQINSDISILASELSQLRNQVQRNFGQLEEEGKSLKEGLAQLNTSLEKDIEGLSGRLESARQESKEQAADIEKTISTLEVGYQDFSDVIELTVQSVVSVQTNTGTGSGFFINRDGHIVTNYHVIEDASSGVIVTHDGEQYDIQIVGWNENADIAVLKVDAGYNWLNFGSSHQTRVGERVIAIGNPGGLDFSVTQGIVSATNRNDEKGNTYIQIDVAINPGNSGGPLIDASGDVIGVNTLKLAGFEGVGFALSSDHVNTIVNLIIG